MVSIKMFFFPYQLHQIIYLKLMSTIFYQVFIFHQMIALQKLWKMFFRGIQIVVFSSSPLFFPVSHCFTGWSKENLKVYDIIDCQNKNLRHFVWYLEKEIRYYIETLSIGREVNKENCYGKIMQKMCTKLYFFFRAQSLLMDKVIKNKRDLELVTCCSSGHKAKSEKFLYWLFIIWPSLMM